MHRTTPIHVAAWANSQAVSSVASVEISFSLLSVFCLCCDIVLFTCCLLLPLPCGSVYLYLLRYVVLLINLLSVASVAMGFCLPVSVTLSFC